MLKNKKKKFPIFKTDAAACRFLEKEDLSEYDLSGFQRVHFELEKTEWHPFKTAPKDGTELIFWISSQKGFEDMTANFYFGKGKWRWAATDDVLKRPDLVNGWLFYPQPPVKIPNKKTIAAMKE